MSSDPRDNIDYYVKQALKDAHRRSGIAKLTDNEIDALGLHQFRRVNR